MDNNEHNGQSPAPDNTFGPLLREAWQPELPYGFAERVARAAMERVRVSVWSLILSWTPQTTVLAGAAAIALFVVGMTGAGPNLVDSVRDYASLSNIFQVP